MQFHEIIRMDDPDRIFAPGGAMEALLAARQAGKIRYIGFTGHKDPAIHLRMLKMPQARLPLRHRADAAQRAWTPTSAASSSSVLPVLVRAATSASSA